MDYMFGRRNRRVLSSADDNLDGKAVNGLNPLGKTLKDVKKPGLALQTRNLIKASTAKAQEKKVVEKVSLVTQRKHHESTNASEIPPVASIALYNTSTFSTSFVTPECFDDETTYLHYIERSRAIPQHFLERKAVTGRMRQILFDWILQVVERFAFQHETLQLAWIVADRALTKMNISKDKLQLLGATCLFISTKYEEVQIPHINDFVYLSASAFTKKDIMTMERDVFKAINFNIGFAYPISFLRRYRYALQNNDKSHPLSKLFLDIFMTVYDLGHKLPSTMAQVALYLAYFVNGRKLPAAVYSLMGTTEAAIRNESSDFVSHIIAFSTMQKEMVLHRKYAREVSSRLVEGQLDLLKTLKRV